MRISAQLSAVHSCLERPGLGAHGCRIEDLGIALLAFVSTALYELIRQSLGLALASWCSKSFFLSSYFPLFALLGKVKNQLKFYHNVKFIIIIIIIIIIWVPPINLWSLVDDFIARIRGRGKQPRHPCLP